MKQMKMTLGILVLASCFAFAGTATAATFDPLAVENFMPGSTILNNTSAVRALPSQAKSVGSVTYTYGGQTKTVDQFINGSNTDSFIALDSGSIAYERYLNGNNSSTKHQSWSMMKSYVSTLIGIAVKNGKITSINDPVTKYVPALAANGYNGVKIKDVLQMASGIKWDEAGDESSAGVASGDAYNMVSESIFDNLTFGLSGQTLDEFTTSPDRVRVETPGTHFNYTSANTQVLRMVLEKATGQRLRALLQNQIWKPAGMGLSATLLRDRVGSDYAFCCLFAAARDYARFGLLWENNGKYGTNQIVPTNWVYSSTHSTESYLQPGAVETSWGYGYQWWLGDGTRGDFSAVGLEGQFTYVSPNDDTVIVKLSSDEGTDRIEETLRVFRAIADYLKTH
ncbi:MAG: serine hydrolase [Thermoleophilaceae bacterium]|nr:serine hydrolase [Thermoleophilaceae bacterium]